MAKTSGGSRGSNPRSMYGDGNTATRENYPAWMSNAGWNRIIDSLSAGDYPGGWVEIDQDHRELALMEAGFNGLANDDAEDIIFETSKERMSALLTDTVLNNWESDSWDADYMVTIGYKDGSTRTNEEIAPAKAITGRQLVKTQFGIVDKTLFGKDVAYVTLNSPSGAYYWSIKGDNTIIEHTGYEKWTRGRGTKRRSYIQDDWI